MHRGLYTSYIRPNVLTDEAVITWADEEVDECGRYTNTGGNTGTSVADTHDHYSREDLPPQNRQSLYGKIRVEISSSVCPLWVPVEKVLMAYSFNEFNY